MKNKKEKRQGAELRHNARQAIVDNYALKDLLPQHIEYVKSLALKAKALV